MDSLNPAEARMDLDGHGLVGTGITLANINGNE